MYRLVGFFEYARALESFDSLLKHASSEELAVIDQIVKQSPELTVYTNLSRHLETRPSTLCEPFQAGGFEQRGFGWVVPLARLEYAAMHAGFTHLPQSFTAVNPTDYEIDEYKELLLDGLRTHVWALLNDAELRQVTSNGSSGTRLLAYFRRALLAQRFADGVATLHGKELTSEQQAELALWMRQLKELKQDLAQNVSHRLMMLSGAEQSAQEGKQTTVRKAYAGGDLK